jgi:sigma-B regulation protein RsbU (phosphoserine phosphatase)
MNNYTDKDSEPLLRVTFPAQAGELQRIREVVRTCCVECGCSGTLASDLVLAVDEACQNIVRHAYGGAEDGEATLEIFCRDSEVEFRLLDSAPPVDKEKLRPVWPKKVQPGGLGVCLIHDIMDEVEHISPPTGQGNLLRMVKSFKRDSE